MTKLVKSNLLIKNINPELRYSPLIADKIPKLKDGSREHEDYWGQVRQWCLEGYKPSRGHWIPPNLFFHLNIWKISRRRFPFDQGRGNKITGYPLYRDVDDDIIFKSIYEKRKDSFLGKGKGGIIFGKRRRIGITDALTSHTYWETCMFPDNNVFVGTPTPLPLKNIRKKFDIGHRNLPKEFFENLLINNKEQITLGVEEVTPEGTRNIGTLSNIAWVLFNKAGAYKSEWASFGLFDEIGEYTDNPTLLEVYLENVDSFKEGDNWIGTPCLAGTTDTKNVKNTHFMDMWYNHKAYDLEKVFISGDYYFGDKYFDLHTGKSDRPAARKTIEERKAVLNRLSDKTALLKYRQNNPLSEDDMFLVMGNTAINMQRLNEQIKKCVNNLEAKHFGERGNFTWVKLRDKNNEWYWDAVWNRNQDGKWFKCHDKVNDQYPGADIIGVDDYFKDNAPQSESLGGLCVYRRFVPTNHIISKIPVCTYLYRPSTLSQFHDDCLITSVYYDARAAVEYHNEIFKEYYLNSEKVNGRRYLKTYPRTMNKVVKEMDAFGYHVGALEKELIIGRIAEWVNSPALENCYDLVFLEQIGKIGTSNSDLGSAFGICLLYESDLNSVAVKNVEDIQASPRVQAQYTMGEDGVPQPLRYTPQVTYAMRQRHSKLHWMNTINRND